MKQFQLNSYSNGGFHSLQLYVHEVRACDVISDKMLESYNRIKKTILVLNMVWCCLSVGIIVIGLTRKIKRT